jgi:predicted MFS family arabinose efflux permease
VGAPRLVNIMTVETKDISHARLPREARILVAARVVDRLGGFTLAFLPLLLVTAYDAPLRAAGLVTAGFGLATIPSRLLGGRLADRLGRRATIVLGLVGCALAQTLLAVAPDLALAAAGALLLGLCFEIYEPPSQALLADVTGSGQRAAAYSALGAGIAAAGVLAGVLAALLAGHGLRWLFVADALTCLACAAIVRWGLPRDRPASASRVAANSPWRDPRLLLMLGSGTAFATTYMVMVGGLPLALNRGGVASGWAGALVAVSAATVIAGTRVRSLLPPAWGPFRRMALGYLLLALGLGLAVPAALVAAGTGTGAAYLLPVVVWSVGDALLLGEPFAVVAGLAAPADRGRYLAAYGVCWGVATTAAPLLVTGLLAASGPAVLWGTCAVAALALACIQSRLGAAVTRQ